MKGFYCDLAADLTGGAEEKDGVKREVVQAEGRVTIERIILDENAGKKLGISRGKYVTVSRPDAFFGSADEKTEFAKILSDELRTFLPEKNGKRSALVIGLGNGYISADALGKKTAEKIMATRGEKELCGLNEVSVFSAGVPALTGIQSYEVVRGLVSEITPDFVICVDSLSAFGVERIGRAYQITDTGIRAGGGVNNASPEKIDEKTLGIPVIAVGVPFVISAKRLLEDATKGNCDVAGALGGEDMLVTVGSIEAMTSAVSDALASALNICLLS